MSDERYRDPEVVQENARHIVQEVIPNFIANRTAEEVYHEAQERGFPTLMPRLLLNTTCATPKSFAAFRQLGRRARAGRTAV